MSAEIRGIPLADFSDPIRTSLKRYQAMTDGRYSFDLDAAGTLERTLPDVKPNSARSVSNVLSTRRDAVKKIADLVVVVFAPRDATGDDSIYHVDELEMGLYPKEKKYLPRSKQALHTEAHLALSTHKIDSVDEPALFAGRLSVLGVVGYSRVEEIGYVGQSKDDFTSALTSHDLQAPPTVTLTTGYRNRIMNPDLLGERFGDPHALLNDNETTIQVAAFIGIAPAFAGMGHLELFKQLRAHDLHASAV